MRKESLEQQFSKTLTKVEKLNHQVVPQKKFLIGFQLTEEARVRSKTLSAQLWIRKTRPELELKPELVCFRIPECPLPPSCKSSLSGLLLRTPFSRSDFQFLGRGFDSSQPQERVNVLECQGKTSFETLLLFERQTCWSRTPQQRVMGLNLKITSTLIVQLTPGNSKISYIPGPKNKAADGLKQIFWQLYCSQQ